MTMMDTREAVRSLDIYSDDLVSLGLLLRCGIVQNKTDEEMWEIHEGLENAIIEKQKQAITLAHDMVATKDRRGTGSDPLSDALGVNAAIQRCVLAINEANESVRDVRLEQAAKERKAKEAKEAKKTKKENPVSQGTVNDPAKAPTGRVAGEQYAGAPSGCAWRESIAANAPHKQRDFATSAEMRAVF